MRFPGRTIPECRVHRSAVVTDLGWCGPNRIAHGGQKTVDEDTFYAEVIEWLKERGHAQPEIERILERIRRYERETQTDSLMESYGKGGMTLSAIIAEALGEAEKQ